MKQFWQNSRALWLGLALLTTTAVDAGAQTTPAQDVVQNLDTSDEALVKQLPGFTNDYADVNGIRLQSQRAFFCHPSCAEFKDFGMSLEAGC